MDLTLLPEAHETIACADHTRRNAVDPGGTAIAADILVAIDVALPWPKPVFDHPLLVEVGAVVAECSTPARVLAAVPDGAGVSDGDVSTAASLVAYRLRDATMERTTVTAAADAASIADAVRSLLAQRSDVSWRPAATAAPEVWICTQGSHDRCCGSDGTRLANELHARRSDVIVRRVSHTGGHRFAPTLLTMPDGRMWAYADADLVDKVVDRSGETATLAERCRGWVGAATGPAQVAERAIFAQSGWSWDAAVRRVEVHGGAGSGDAASERRVSVQGTAPNGEGVAFEVGVAPGREVPSIRCHAPGGLPAKPGREYRVTGVAALA